MLEARTECLLRGLELLFFFFFSLRGVNYFGNQRASF